MCFDSCSFLLLLASHEGCKGSSFGLSCGLFCLTGILWLCARALATTGPLPIEPYNSTIHSAHMYTPLLPTGFFFMCFALVPYCCSHILPWIQYIHNIDQKLLRFALTSVLISDLIDFLPSVDGDGRWVGGGMCILYAHIYVLSVRGNWVKGYPKRLGNEKTQGCIVGSLGLPWFWCGKWP